MGSEASHRAILAPVSVGELVDKITILEIKSQNTLDDQLINVTNELDLLKETLHRHELTVQSDLMNELRQVNRNLWVIEDQIRLKEKNLEFDDVFIKLARSVYKENDKRGKLKRTLNDQLDSFIVEEKIYTDY